MEDVAGAAVVGAIVKRRWVGFATGFLGSFDHRLRSASKKQGAGSFVREGEVRVGRDSDITRGLSQQENLS